VKPKRSRRKRTRAHKGHCDGLPVTRRYNGGASETWVRAAPPLVYPTSGRWYRCGLVAECFVELRLFNASCPQNLLSGRGFKILHHFSEQEEGRWPKPDEDREPFRPCFSTPVAHARRPTPQRDRGQHRAEAQAVQNITGRPSLRKLSAILMKTPFFDGKTLPS
jgi:hypothetical protein